MYCQISTTPSPTSTTVTICYTMVLFSTVSARASRLPAALYARLTQTQLLEFFDVSTRFVPFIVPPKSQGARPDDRRTPVLPANIALVLSMHTELPVEDVNSLWGVLGDIVMNAQPGELVLLPGSTDASLSAIAPAHHLGTYYYVRADSMISSMLKTHSSRCRDLNYDCKDMPQGRLSAAWAATWRAQRLRRASVHPTPGCPAYPNQY